MQVGAAQQWQLTCNSSVGSAVSTVLQHGLLADCHLPILTAVCHHAITGTAVQAPNGSGVLAPACATLASGFHVYASMHLVSGLRPS